MKKEPGSFVTPEVLNDKATQLRWEQTTKWFPRWSKRIPPTNRHNISHFFFLLLFFFFFVKSYSKKESSLSGFQLFTYCVLRFPNPLLNDRISNNLFRSGIIKPFLFKSNRDYECVSQLRVEQTAATSKKIHQV